jgi:hypothetical protein
MTSNTTPSPFVVSTSSSWSSSRFLGWAAFNKKSTTGSDDCWSSLNSQMPNTIGDEWLQIKLGQPRILTRFVLRSRGSSSSTKEGLPQIWTIEGSQDNVSFNVIQSYTKTDYATTNTYTPYEFLVNNKISYLYYRLHITKIIYGSSVLLGEWELYSTYR